MKINIADLTYEELETLVEKLRIAKLEMHLQKIGSQTVLEAR